MNESIATRVGRIISGGVHQLISAFENSAPEAVMEKAIREIDDVIEEVRAELGTIVARKHMATRRLAEADSEHRDLGEKIELALNESRDDLAETAISRQLDLEAQLPVLESTIKEYRDREAELEGYITALQAKMREMTAELRQVRKSCETPSAPGAGETPVGDAGRRVSRAESAFDRVLEQQTGLRGGGADINTASQLLELEELARKNRIRERLAAAKARATGDS